MVRQHLVFLLVLLATQSPVHSQTGDDWISVGGDRGSSRYSLLNQIDRSNVGKLKVAWTFAAGELVGGKGNTIECTPVVVDGVAYITTAKRRVVAIDGATGKQLWNFDPVSYGRPAGPLASGGVNRGVAYWSDGKPEGERRILHGTADGRIYSLDARTGKLDPMFGREGAKDLREDINRDLTGFGYGPTSAPAIYKQTVIVGFSNGEGPGPAAPGDVRAFDVRTGKQKWRFHTVPRPGEFGNETWAADSWKDRGGANAWSGATVDSNRGLIFVGLGSAAFDFYGGDRHGDNLFANCTVALDAETGQRRWHYQTLRHDLWDHDLPAYPNCVTVKRDGKSIDAIAQVTKTGYVFLFDRETGEPLFPIEDVAVPQSEMPGEKASATQPIPKLPPPFAAQHFDESNVTNIGDANRQGVLKQLAELKRGPAFNPPSLQGTVAVPGFHGGANWSGASFDPTSGLLFVNATNFPNIITLQASPAGSTYPYQHTGYNRFLDHEGYPAIAPPWGELIAIDLNSGKFAWRTALGEFEELTKRGVPQTGTDNFGGSIVTAGGLVFIAATRDEKFRAFDKATGKLLWEAQLPAGGYATPATYAASGKQFVLIAAGGAGKLGTKAGDQFVAFAISDD